MGGQGPEFGFRAIFREELAAVYASYDAPVQIRVFLDLENASNDGWRNALGWLKGCRFRLSGVACTKHDNKDACRFLKEGEFGIEFRRTPNVGPKGQEADAAILVEFGRATHRVTTRDFVCFIAVRDKIYKSATEIALREGMKVLRFCGSDSMGWTPKNKGVYRPLDIDGPAESWDQALEGLVGR